MKVWGLLLVVIMAAGGVDAADAIEALPIEKEASEIIGSLEQIDRIARTTQEQFWKLVPPSSDDPFYLHPDHVVRAVDWKSKAWPKSLLKQMYAEMETVGRSMYPFYRMTVVETRLGSSSITIRTIKKYGVRPRR